MPGLERDHVMAVYDTIADQWDGTRYKPWPRVAEFIRRQPAGAVSTPPLPPHACLT